jgi:hypothetical protein
MATNIAYFHRTANGRQGKSGIQYMDNNGISIEGTKNLLQHATDDYKDLFGPGPQNQFQLSHDF